MKIVKGDIIKLALAGELDVIIHGCNCFHTMGAGLAKQISDQFPEAFSADKRTLYADLAKLGSFSAQQITRDDVRFLVVNAYTQYLPGANAEYAAIKMFCDNFYEMFSGFNLRIGIPEIGCGIGGLATEQVEVILDAYLKDMDVTLVIYDG